MGYPAEQGETEQPSTRIAVESNIDKINWVLQWYMQLIGTSEDKLLSRYKIPWVVLAFCGPLDWLQCIGIVRNSPENSCASDRPCGYRCLCEG